MFQKTVKRSAIGLSLAVCLFWVAWTQGYQSRENRSRSNPSGDAIILPTGFLPTKSLKASRPIVVDLSAENLSAYSGDRNSTADFLSWFDFYALPTRQEPNGVSDAIAVADVDFGGAAEKQTQAPNGTPMLVNQDLAQAAADLFSTPFDAIFSSLFSVSGSNAGTGSISGGEDQNPFTKAKQDSGASDSNAAENAEAKSSDDPVTQQTSMDAMKASGNPETRFLFLGDWDGSGILQSAAALRLNEATFAFPDGQRTFNLFVNPTAVEQKRSLAVEDINGDSIPDLLITGGDSLFGGVYAGDTAGSFSPIDTFVTGYEPMLAAVGPFHGGKREIITFNTRSGSMVTFRYADRFIISKRQSLDFAPDYVGRLVDQNRGTEHMLAARLGQEANTYQVLEDDTLSQSPDTLPSQPAMVINRDFLGKGAAQGLLQIFQTGRFASLVLSDANGDTYNVANLHVYPHVFIVIGDLNNDDTVDVGVAILK